jgi:hypothetical protein
MSQPTKRMNTDGPINVRWEGDELLVTETHNGETGTIRLSAFNARRVLAAMSMLLDLPLSKSAAKSIAM